MTKPRMDIFDILLRTLFAAPALLAGTATGTIIGICILTISAICAAIAIYQKMSLKNDSANHAKKEPRANTKISPPHDLIDEIEAEIFGDGIESLEGDYYDDSF